MRRASAETASQMRVFAEIQIDFDAAGVVLRFSLGTCHHTVVLSRLFLENSGFTEEAFTRWVFNIAATVSITAAMPEQHLHAIVLALGRSLERRAGGQIFSQKARETLLYFLSPAQKAHFLSHAAFFVTGGDTGTLYLLEACNYLNIHQLQPMEFGNALNVSSWQRMCVSTADAIPVFDLLLAQKLLFQFDEARAKANCNYFNHFGTQALASLFGESEWNLYPSMPCTWQTIASDAYSTRKS